MVEETFMERVQQERTDLAERLDKLETFVTTKAHTVETGALNLLKIQGHAMKLYLHTLDMRLHLLSGGE